MSWLQVLVLCGHFSVREISSAAETDGDRLRHEFPCMEDKQMPKFSGIRLTVVSKKREKAKHCPSKAKTPQGATSTSRRVARRRKALCSQLLRDACTRRFDWFLVAQSRLLCQEKQILAPSQAARPLAVSSCSLSFIHKAGSNF